MSSEKALKQDLPSGHTFEEILKSDLLRKWRISIPAAQMKRAFEGALQKRAENTRYPGFRKGKAPMWLVESQEKDLKDQVIVDQIHESWACIKKENALKIFEGSERIEDIAAEPYTKNSEDLLYTVEFELAPEVPEVNLDSIAISEREFKITQEDIDKHIEKYKAEVVVYQDSETGYSAQKKDKVLADFEGKINDKPFKGGSYKEHEIIIGQGKILKELEDGLIGTKAGDKKNIEVHFPKDYHMSFLAGKSGVFEVQIKSIKRSISANTKELLMEALNYKTDQELQEKIRSSLNEACAQLLKNEMRLALEEKLLEGIDFQVPNSIKEALENGEKQILEAQGIDISDKDQEIKEKAKKRAMLSLMFSKFAEKNSIKVAKEDIMQYIIQLSAKFGYTEDFFRLYTENKDFASRVNGSVAESKIVDEMLKKVTTEKISSSVDEILKEKDTKKEVRLEGDE